MYSIPLSQHTLQVVTFAFRIHLRTTLGNSMEWQTYGEGFLSQFPYSYLREQTWFCLTSNVLYSREATPPLKRESEEVDGGCYLERDRRDEGVRDSNWFWIGLFVNNGTNSVINSICLRWRDGGTFLLVSSLEWVLSLDREIGLSRFEMLETTPSKTSCLFTWNLFSSTLSRLIHHASLGCHTSSLDYSRFGVVAISERLIEEAYFFL